MTIADPMHPAFDPAGIIPQVPGNISGPMHPAFDPAGIIPQVPGNISGEPQFVVGSLFGSIWHRVESVARGAGKIAKGVVRSPLTKMVAGGIAFVVPPVGVPATAALIAADKVIGAVDSADKNLSDAAKRTIANTGILAKAGHRQAQAGLKILAIAKKNRRIHPAISRTPRGGPPNEMAAKRAILDAASRARDMAEKAAVLQHAPAMLAQARAADRAESAASMTGWTRSKEGSYRFAS